MRDWSRLCVLLSVGTIAASMSEPGAAADDKRPPLPDNKTIDTFQYTFTPKVLGGSVATLSIHKDGRVMYSYASAPHTGSGGRTVQKEWKLAKRERLALLRGLVDDGLLDLEDTGGGKFPNHYIGVSYGRWVLSIYPKKLPENLLKRLRPLLQKAHPEEWGTAQDKERPRETGAAPDPAPRSGFRIVSASCAPPGR